MNPKHRTNWPEAFADFRAMIDATPLASQSATRMRCEDCGGVLHLVRGRHSGKWFYTHQGHGCEGVRSIFFDDREAAEKAEVVFL